MRLRLPALLLPLLLFVAACDSGADDRIVGGVNVSELFSAPTAGEKQALLAEWSTRDVTPQNVTVEAELHLLLQPRRGRARSATTRPW